MFRKSCRWKYVRVFLLSFPFRYPGRKLFAQRNSYASSHSWWHKAIALRIFKIIFEHCRNNQKYTNCMGKPTMDSKQKILRKCFNCLNWNKSRGRLPPNRALNLGHGECSYRPAHFPQRAHPYYTRQRTFVHNSSIKIMQVNEDLRRE